MVPVAPSVGDSEEEDARRAEACVAYTSAWCRANELCAGSTLADIYTCSTRCPDNMFAPGSTRTIEGLFECATAFETLSCEDWAANRLPSCVTPGTRQLGEPCAFSTQCATLVCVFGDSTCGVCGEWAGEGEDCSSDLVDCGYDLTCRDGICSPYPTYTQDLGEPCDGVVRCRGQSREASCTGGICVANPSAGSPCIGNRCQPDAYCSVQDPDPSSGEFLCRIKPGLDEPCGEDASTVYPACAEGLACSSEPRQELGTCIEPYDVPLGESCLGVAVGCEAGQCECVDDECTDKRCRVRGGPGEPCSDITPCHDAFVCEEGRCVYPTYRGLFEEACGE